MHDDLKNEITGIAETVKGFEQEQAALAGQSDPASRSKHASIMQALSHARKQLAEKMGALARLEAMNDQQAKAESERARLAAMQHKIEGVLAPARRAEEARCLAMHPEWEAELIAVIKKIEAIIRSEYAESRQYTAEIRKLTAELREAGVSMPQLSSTQVSAERLTMILLEQAMKKAFPWGV